MSSEIPTQPRAWQRMLSGRRLDLLAPSPADIEIEDIAHGLARVARWNGQTTGDHAFSVAQHALLVETIFTACHDGKTSDDAPSAAKTSSRNLREFQLTALLHDAPEYVIGDMISPFKNALGLDYATFEGRLQIAIHTRFDLPTIPRPEIKTAIKTADTICAYFEATVLAGFSLGEAETFFGKPQGLPGGLIHSLENLAPLQAAQAQNAFLARFDQLFEGGSNT